MKALLALEDGRSFEGESFGATGTRVGEICFNTAMTGYQEVLKPPVVSRPDRGDDLSINRKLRHELTRSGKLLATRARFCNRRAQRDPEELALGDVAR